jgi:hypothetical protein
MRSTVASPLSSLNRGHRISIEAAGFTFDGRVEAVVLFGASLDETEGQDG